MRDDGDSFFDILTNISLGAYPENVVSNRIVKSTHKFHAFYDGTYGEY